MAPLTPEGMGEDPAARVPGVCVPWETKRTEYGDIMGDPEILRSEWEKIDSAAYVYLWWWVNR